MSILDKILMTEVLRGAMRFYNQAEDKIVVVDVYEHEGLYYSQAEGENAIEWRIMQGERPTAQYRPVFRLPGRARQLEDIEIPANLARTLEVVYTHSPF